MLKSTKKAKMKLCIRSPKKNGEKQGELLIKLNATKERNKTRYVDSLRMGKQVRNASMSYNHIHCER